MLKVAGRGLECCGNEVRRELTKALGVEAALNLCELPGARKAVKAWVAWRCCATVLPDHFAPGRPCRFENGSRAAQDWYVVSCASPQCHGECSTLRRQPSCPEAVSWRQHWASQMYLHIYRYTVYISSSHSHPNWPSCFKRCKTNRYPDYSTAPGILS